MANITIRNLPDEVVRRLKEVATRNGISMEQEVRTLLARRYGDRADVITRVRQRWSRLPSPEAADVERWRRMGRP
jgi:plasmid stability protein